MRRSWAASIAESLYRPAVTGLGVFILTLPFLEPAQSQARYADRWQEIVHFCGTEWGFAGAVAACLREKDREFGAHLTLLYQNALRNAGYNSGAIRRSQSEWLRYQASTCLAAERTAQHEGPAIARLAGASCLVRTTLQRMDELENLMSN